ncbi:MAG TPA: Gfo/Idh/MocA family oxidoreductase [Verrucomicrobiae bacterium]|nr:Gfo/Idh/MocA family oxidoreductase [Verrucomicrobiae bacterium]
MKALVVGGGSIGIRHLRNLKKLGMAGLALVENDIGRREAVAAEVGAAGFEDLTEGLKWAPDFAVIASPTYLHIGQALEVAQMGVALFVEKPLAHVPQGLAELVDLVENKQLTSLVGCNMRFHPGPAKVKQLLDEKRLGMVLFARVHTGSYLPDWRPHSDYRQNYAARVATGGGCLMDCVHEIDLARWFLGEMESVFCCAPHLSSLEIETEDVAALICRHAGGAMSEIHLDYVQRTYERGCQIVGECGSIFWDFSGRSVRWYDAASKEWKIFAQPERWEMNDMYIDEMNHFLTCLRENRPPTLPIPDAASLMQVVFAARSSSEQGKMIDVGVRP